jgi:hypothetical protein
VPVASPRHLLHLFAMPKIQLTQAVFKSQGLRVMAICFVFAEQRADYTVKFGVFAK